MITFTALYRGRTVAGAKLIAVSIDPQVAAYVAEQILQEPDETQDDPVTSELEFGRRASLERIKDEARKPFTE